MPELLPTFQTLKDRSDQIDQNGKAVLGIQPLQTLTGASCDLKRLVSFILDESARLGHNIDPDNVTIRITHDGADIAGRKAELIALVPTFQDDCQSLHAVYPLCIFIGKESRQNIIDACNNGTLTLKQQMRQLRERHQYKATGRAWVGIKWKFSADMVGALKVLYKDRSDMTEEESRDRGACPCCKAYKDKDGWWRVEDWGKEVPLLDKEAEDYLLKDALFDVGLHDMCFCCLHMNLRIFPKLLSELLLTKAMQRDVQTKSSQHVDALQAALGEEGCGVKGFKICRAGEWNGKEILKGPSLPTLRGDQLKKVFGGRGVGPHWIAAAKAAWGVKGTDCKDAQERRESHRQQAGAQWDRVTVSAGKWPQDLKAALNLINLWITLYGKMTSRTRLEDSECERFGQEVAAFCRTWKGAHLSETPYCMSPPHVAGIRAACMSQK
jgi:hypothetical protein